MSLLVVVLPIPSCAPRFGVDDWRNKRHSCAADDPVPIVDSGESASVSPVGIAPSSALQRSASGPRMRNADCAGTLTLSSETATRSSEVNTSRVALSPPPRNLSNCDPLKLGLPSGSSAKYCFHNRTAVFESRCAMRSGMCGSSLAKSVPFFCDHLFSSSVATTPHRCRTSSTVCASSESRGDRKRCLICPMPRVACRQHCRQRAPALPCSF